MEGSSGRAGDGERNSWETERDGVASALLRDGTGVWFVNGDGAGVALARSVWGVVGQWGLGMSRAGWVIAMDDVCQVGDFLVARGLLF